ncbi:hypothetical protein QOZ88_11020 [Blastococcus sp. BMG 814]|uniref:LPXTG cell wall anchor domain-containing protein n=1 Tax=Blastococcus carthaginiensis TaxID=3050034 RepID=A0ABT9IC72_9ACTN|nr:hypothetical protein [Blastococcus carthaginiensis]MDP5183171.1 hypothetical protein [Blastococcus carthaginiensis]
MTPRVPTRLIAFFGVVLMISVLALVYGQTGEGERGEYTVFGALGLGSILLFAYAVVRTRRGR